MAESLNQPSCQDWPALLADVPHDWALIPLDGRKRPIDPTTGRPIDWLSGEQNGCSVDDLAAFNGHVKAVGVLTGPPSGGLLAVDFDGPEGPTKFAEVSGYKATDLPRTIGVTSGKPSRGQRFFTVDRDWWPYLANRKVWNGVDGKACLELRWNHCQSAIAGAHPETPGYRWLPTSSPSEISDPATAPDWLLELLVVQEHPDAAPVIPTAGDADRAVAMLDSVPAAEYTSYTDWLRIGMALHHTDPGLLTLWVKWCKGMGDAFDEAECLRKWESFGKGHSGRSATIATLHYLAKKHGYKEPPRPDPLAGFAAAPDAEKGNINPALVLRTAASDDRELAQSSAAEHLANLSAHVDLESVLPPRLAKRLTARAAAFPIDPVALLVPLLCTVAGVVGTRCRVVVKQGWSEPLVIWGGNVIPPGALKSPVGEVLCKPLLELQQESFAAHEATIKAQKAFEEHKEPNECKQASANTPPPPRRWVVMDATYERVAEIIAATNTFGLVSFQDELATWFANLERQPGSGARAGWLTLWSGGAALLDRKVANSSFAYQTAASLFGNIQPEKLQELIQRGGDDPAAAGDGLWSRFLWCRPPESVWRYVPEGCDIRPEILAMLRGLDAVPTGLELQMSPEAIRLMVPWAEHWAEEGMNSSPARAAFLAKLRGYTVRLAGIVHLLQCNENSSVLPGPAIPTFHASVGSEAMDQALLLASYFLAQFDAISTEMGGGSLPPDVAAFLRWVKDGKRNEVRPRDLLTGPRFARGWKTADALAFLKLVAEEHGQGKVVQGNRKDSFAWCGAGA